MYNLILSSLHVYHLHHRVDFSVVLLTEVTFSHLYFLTPDFNKDTQLLYTFDQTIDRSTSELDLSKCFLPIRRAHSLSKFLITPVIPEKARHALKSSGRVLTSVENMAIMDEKLKIKQKKFAEKEERQKTRQEKKIAKAKEAVEK